MCELTHTTLNVTEIGYGLRVLGSVVGSQSCSVCKLGPVCGAFVFRTRKSVKKWVEKAAVRRGRCGLRLIKKRFSKIDTDLVLP